METLEIQKGQNYGRNTTSQGLNLGNIEVIQMDDYLPEKQHTM